MGFDIFAGWFLLSNRRHSLSFPSLLGALLPLFPLLPLLPLLPLFWGAHICSAIEVWRLRPQARQLKQRLEPKHVPLQPTAKTQDGATDCQPAVSPDLGGLTTQRHAESEIFHQRVAQNALLLLLHDMHMWRSLQRKG
jgi:hypothetical protein